LATNIHNKTGGKPIPKLKTSKAQQDMLIMIGGSSQQGIKDKKPLLQALSNINPYKLPAELKVKPPFGEDHFIAILCTKPPTGLHEILSNSAPNIPKDPTKLFRLCRSNFVS